MARLTDEQAAMLLAYAKQVPESHPGIGHRMREGGDIMCHSGNGNAWAMLVLDLLDRVAALEAERDEARADCKAMAAALDNASPMKRVHVSCGTASCDVVFLGVLETPELLAVVQRWAP